MNKCLIFIVMMLLCSCGKDWALKEESFYIASDNRDWVTGDKYGTGFIMTDNNGISQGFMMAQNSTDLSPKTTYIFGIRTSINKYESFTQSWSSNFGQNYMMILAAGFLPYGDRISISFNELIFMYDFGFKTIGHIYYYSGSKSKPMTDVGYDNNVTINSVVEMLDSLNVNGKKYEGVLHFTLMDFQDQWSDFTLREIFVARKFGLIKYSLNNGITYER